jgi:hypothetical protein
VGNQPQEGWGIIDPYTSAPWFTPAFQVFASHGRSENKNDNKGDNKSNGDNTPSQVTSAKHSDSGHGVKKD